MSLEPLLLGFGRKIANVLAGLARGGMLFSVLLVVALIPLLSDITEPRGQVALLIALASGFGAVSVVCGQVFIHAALGRSRTRGSVAYYSGAQVLMAALGVAGGFAFSAFTRAESPGVTSALLALALLVGAASVILFIRWSRRRLVPLAPAAEVSTSTAIVADHWDPGIGRRLGAMSMSVVSFSDGRGDTWFVRHLHAESFVFLGTIGKMQFQRNRPGHRPRFVPPRREATATTREGRASRPDLPSA
ncbi:hypothetical protein [Rothia halotolerans]|uniref:hypothetical protein n=1 Tax=Rothia halotolerans TaxID=405770 RepID=UPI00101DE3A9|nr:hypothetical protein [Rothia halotolerans]